MEKLEEKIDNLSIENKTENEIEGLKNGFYKGIHYLQIVESDKYDSIYNDAINEYRQLKNEKTKYTKYLTRWLDDVEEMASK